ncbi:MAG: DUF72 domain-containing protein [Desulfobacteraceae bacterium]|nr:MAG: DUF72 domain-containing protein [Desulfobacteraceae bacterium]
MRLFAGTSGYSYKEWKGPFYPQDLPDRDMLRYYSTHLPAVEINNTFYRMPGTGVLTAWAAQVPPDFRFVLKAPRKITHAKPLLEKEAEIDYLFRAAATLGDRLGAVLFQLPPYLHRNTELLAAFVDLLPSGARTAFEFRHRSWFEEEIYTLLRNKGCALCCSDGDKEELRQFVATAGWGYLRLRKPDYVEADLSAWARRIKNQKWEAVYIFFKHEDAGAGPKLAKQFLELASGQ